ncbi:hypothetical protein PABY_11070 [Pyrodictium abyssi]|uniref:Uncharacterized protein n=1 Tax=Pyrodictium abyssi TaxID=54256 RepID=A0ABM8IZE3_9CREN|nr:hypothetical protein PABY_11070 [Pyrodictium abyssi]
MLDAARRFNARFQACYEYSNTRECVRARLEDMLEGARNPALIQSLLARSASRGRSSLLRF